MECEFIKRSVEVLIQVQCSLTLISTIITEILRVKVHRKDANTSVEMPEVLLELN